jgi:TetR/AcrR family transcriptional regulator, transcriptional repressor of bet genes
MPRAPIKNMRRLELQKAAYAAVNELGFRGFALEEVAKHVGAAKGIIHHYFKDKEDLMESVARYATRDLTLTVLQMIKAAKSPSERIWSIIAVNLDAEFFQPYLVRIYLFILTSGTRYNSVLRVYDITHGRTISNLAFALRQLVKPEDVQPISNTIWIMIEGAWLLQADQDKNIAEPTLRILADYLKTAVPEFDSSVIQNLDFSPALSQSST